MSSIISSQKEEHCYSRGRQENHKNHIYLLNQIFKIQNKKKHHYAGPIKELLNIIRNIIFF
jgi:hypothetical protein